MQTCSACGEGIVTGTSVVCDVCEASRDALVSRAQAYIADKPDVRVADLAGALGVPHSDISALIDGGINISGYDADRCDCGEIGDPGLNGRCANCHNKQVERFRAAAGIE